MEAKLLKIIFKMQVSFKPFCMASSFFSKTNDLFENKIHLSTKDLKETFEKMENVEIFMTN
jgi:hypothetical protein